MVPQGTARVVLTSDFEGVFKNAGQGDLFKIAEKEYRKSKVLQGRFVASEIDKDKIPDELKNVIKQITALCSDQSR
jgi:hypothetical protein